MEEKPENRMTEGQSAASKRVELDLDAAMVPGEKVSNDSGANDKRGRMIIAGMVATVILAVIAVVVAGIFQLTSKWLLVCPSDLPVNDPAPVLWKDVVSDKAVTRGIGVPEKLLSQAALRVLPRGDSGSSSDPK